jgi:hypothetical protein
MEEVRDEENHNVFCGWVGSMRQRTLEKRNPLPVRNDVQGSMNKMGLSKILFPTWKIV